MENATKALVIAGAILIAILLISVGIMVFNSASDTIDSSKNNMSSTAIDTFNSKFNRYIGDKVSGSDVRSLLGTIRSSNATDETNQVKVNNGDTIPRDVDVSTSQKYKVDVEYNNGLIVNVTIKDQSGSNIKNTNTAPAE